MVKGINIYSVNRINGKNTIEPRGIIYKDDLNLYPVYTTMLDGQYFVAGDNRGNSFDSRSFGPIMQNKVLAKQMVKILNIRTIFN